MGFFQELFSRPVTGQELKLKLAEVERERRRLQQEHRRAQSRQAALVDRLKEARRGGDRIEVDYVWDEIKAHRAEATLIRREARRANLEGIGLKKYLRGIERLERAKDDRSVKRLIERIRSSSLDDKLARADIKEQDYLDELAAILDSVGLEPDVADEPDPEKDRFLAELDAVIIAEDAGKTQDAAERESRLRERLEDEPGERDSSLEPTE